MVKIITFFSCLCPRGLRDDGAQDWAVRQAREGRTHARTLGSFVSPWRAHPDFWVLRLQRDKTGLFYKVCEEFRQMSAMLIFESLLSKYFLWLLVQNHDNKLIWSEFVQIPDIHFLYGRLSFIFLSIAIEKKQDWRIV